MGVGGHRYSAVAKSTMNSFLSRHIALKTYVLCRAFSEVACRTCPGISCSLSGRIHYEGGQVDHPVRIAIVGLVA